MGRYTLRLGARIDANGNRTVFAYNAAGRMTSMTSALGQKTVMTYDKAGNLTAQTDPMSRTTAFEYDALNRKIRTIYPDATFTSVEYRGCGQKTSETDQLGNTTLFDYDPAGRLIKVTDAMGNVTAYEYDEAGNRTGITDANGNTTGMVYDVLNRLICKTYPSGDHEEYGYDPNGNMIYKVAGSGERTDFEYDVMNREVKRTYASGHVVKRSYHTDGKLKTAEDYRGVQGFGYDGAGRLALLSHPNGDMIEYRYDAQGNRTRLITPHGTTRYTFDALNRIHTVSSPDNETTTYFYDLAGNEIRQEQSSGMKTVKTYDSLNRLTNITNYSPDNSVISSYAYTLNDLGMRTSVVEADGSHVDYAYNAINQLTSEVRTGSHAYSISYVYDRVGNRLSMIRDGVETTYSYNSRNQLISEINAAGGINYAYDEACRMTTKTDQAGTTTYAWIDDDRLAGVTGPGVNVAYEYDFEGKRVERNEGGEIKQYLIDTRLPFGQVIAETNGANMLTAEYVYGLDRISRKADGEVLNYLSDAQGSIRQLADTSGNVTDSYGYLAYGESLWDTGTTQNEFRYVGEQYDSSTRNIYLRPRWYQPQMGRFISSDIIEGRYDRPLTLNKYGYCEGNAINCVDPSGTMGFWYRDYVKYLLYPWMYPWPLNPLDLIHKDQSSSQACVRRWNFGPAAYLAPVRHCYVVFSSGEAWTYDDEGLHKDELTDTVFKACFDLKCGDPWRAECCTDDCIFREMIRCSNCGYDIISHNCCDCVRSALETCGCKIPLGLILANWGI